MRRYLKSEVLLPLVAAAMTVAISVLRTLAICFAYDADVGYYVSGSGYVIAANVLTVLYIFSALALSVLSCFGKLVPSRDPFHARVSALALGCAVCLFSIDQLDRGFGSSRSDICLLLSLICALLGLSFCALTFLKVNTLEPLRAFGALCLSLSFVFHSLCHYMNTSTPINGDLKTVYIFAAITAALFFLSEAKRSISKQNGITARFFALCCCLFCVSVGVSECFAFFFKKEAFSESYTHPMLLLFVGVYAFTRLFAARVPEIIGDKPTEAPTEDEADDLSAQGEVVDVAPEKEDGPEEDQTVSPEQE